MSRGDRAASVRGHFRGIFRISFTARRWPSAEKSGGENGHHPDREIEFHPVQPRHRAEGVDMFGNSTIQDYYSFTQLFPPGSHVPDLAERRQARLSRSSTAGTSNAKRSSPNWWRFPAASRETRLQAGARASQDHWWMPSFPPPRCEPASRKGSRRQRHAQPILGLRNRQHLPGSRIAVSTVTTRFCSRCRMKHFACIWAKWRRGTYGRRR